MKVTTHRIAGRSHGKQRAPRTGELIARILRGAWRITPPPPDFSADELAQATPALLGSGAGPLGWWRIRTSSLADTPAAGRLRDAYRTEVLQSAMRRERIAEAFRLLRGARIEPVLIKGWAVARSYPQVGLRAWTDLDLCIEPQQLTAAKEILAQSPLLAREADFDHFEITDPAGFAARSQLADLDGVDVRVPSPEDHLHLLAIHALRHDVFRPLWLCDVAAVIETRPAGFVWNLALGDDPIRAGWVSSAVGLAHELLGVDLTGTPFESAPPHLPAWLVPAVLEVWNDPYAYRIPSDFFVNALCNPSRIPDALRERWMGPIGASIRMGLPLNGFPRLPIQIAYWLQRGFDQLRRLPGQLRADQA